MKIKNPLKCSHLRGLFFGILSGTGSCCYIRKALLPVPLELTFCSPPHEEGETDRHPQEPRDSESKPIGIHPTTPVIKCDPPGRKTPALLLQRHDEVQCTFGQFPSHPPHPCENQEDDDRHHEEASENQPASPVVTAPTTPRQSGERPNPKDVFEHPHPYLQ